LLQDLAAAAVSALAAAAIAATGRFSALAGDLSLPLFVHCREATVAASLLILAAVATLAPALVSALSLVRHDRILLVLFGAKGLLYQRQRPSMQDCKRTTASLYRKGMNNLHDPE
jgi:hypothetical protein